MNPRLAALLLAVAADRWRRYRLSALIGALLLAGAVAYAVWVNPLGGGL